MAKLDLTKDENVRFTAMLDMSKEERKERYRMNKKQMFKVLGILNELQPTKVQYMKVKDLQKRNHWLRDRGLGRIEMRFNLNNAAEAKLLPEAGLKNFFGDIFTEHQSNMPIG